MLRHYKLFLEDMIQSAESISAYVGQLPKEAFLADKMRVDAVVRNFEIIGEASNNIPSEVRSKYPDVPWQRLADFRNILIHGYFTVNQEILWDVIENKLPPLLERLRNAVSQETG